MSIYNDNRKEQDFKEQLVNISSTTYDLIIQQQSTQLDLAHSVIYLDNELEEGSLIKLMIGIRAILNNRSTEEENNPINLVINSPGGAIHEMLGIIDYIQSLQVPVNTICRGRAFSAAAVLLACGTGTRMVSKRSNVMFHESSTYQGDGTKVSDMSAYMGYIARLENDICELLATHSNKDTGWWKLAQRTDLYLSPEQLLEYGIIDQII